MQKSGENKMAVKKIGALIALDGEKEFRQNVTNCNKSLATLKSEMSLVKAECTGQANSLESLRKKHDVLTRVLDEQKAKEEAVQKALEHSKREYDKVTDGLEKLSLEQEKQAKKVTDLKYAYGEATDKLDIMTRSGKASTSEIKQQKESVKALEQQLKNEQSALDEVNAAIKKGEDNYQTASNRIKDWETKLNTAKTQVIKATAAVRENEQYIKEAEEATNQCATSIDKFGKKVKEAEAVTIDFGTVVKTNLVNTMTNVVKDSLSKATTAILDMESAERQLQSSTGATTAEMKKYKSAMSDLYSDNFGDNISDVADSMALVKRYTGEIDADNLKKVTENGIAMRDVFDMDLSETIRGVDALVDNMGVTSEKAFDLMAKGAQNGLDKSGELADNLTEYSQLWAQAGFSAEEMFTILQNGLDSGAYNLDKVNDFVKEFTISLADGRIEDSLMSFSAETRNLYEEWKIGKVTAKDVFKSVINDLANAENQQEALTTASNTWSALGEDNAMSVITSLNNLNDTYENVQGTMEDIKKIKYDDLGARFETLGRKFQTKVATPIAEKALPKMEKGLDAVIDNMDTLLPLVTGLGAGAIAYKTATKAVELYQGAVVAAKATQAAFTTATEGATTATTLFNAAANANPFVLIATVAVAAGTALAMYASNVDTASESDKQLIERNQKVCESAKEVADATEETISTYKNSTAEMRAQGEYAETLSSRIEKLAQKTERTNEENSVMQSYIAELNELVPDLNLAYDEQAGKLNMTNEELEAYLENSQREIEIQAAKEYAIELIKKRSELEIEAIKLANEKEELDKKISEAEVERAGTATSAQMGLYWAVKDVVKAQRENTEASEENKQKQEDLKGEISAVQEYLEQYEIGWDEVTSATNENSDATKTNADAQTAAAESNAAAIQVITESYTDMQKKVSDVLESQMNMFEEFNSGTDISSEKLLENMQSQITGVTNWADNLTTLVERGVNQGILDQLQEMGPQGSSYVQAFVDMTDEQLQQANTLWSQSLSMKEGINSSVEGMIEEYTVALNGGRDHVNELMKEFGTDTVYGLVNGIKTVKDQAKEAGGDIGGATTEGTKEALDIHSPSKVFYKIGENVTQGLVNGISDKASDVVFVTKTMSKKIEKKAKDALNDRTLYQDGINMDRGLANGIQAGTSEVISATAYMCAQAIKETKTKLKIHSPSKVFEELGKFTAEGFGVGYENRMDDVNRMISRSMQIPEITGINANSNLVGEKQNSGRADISLDALKEALSKLSLVAEVYVGEENIGNAMADMTVQKITNHVQSVRMARGY